MSPLDDDHIQSLRSVYAGTLLTSSDGSAYEDALQKWGLNTIVRTKVVTQPRTTSEIQSIVSWCSAQSPVVKIVVQGGGHGLRDEGIVDGVLINLGVNMRSVGVDVDAKTVTAQSGALWADVNAKAIDHDLAVVGGTVSHTGVAGLTLGGGHGWLGGQYGLTIDNLISCDIIISSGELLTVSSSKHPELFWALKGAGKNFGIVTSFTFQAHPQTDYVLVGDICFAPAALPELLDLCEDLAPTLPANSGMFFEYFTGTDDVEIRVELFFNGDEETGRKCFEPVLTAGYVLRENVRMAPYPEINEQNDLLFPHEKRYETRGISMNGIDRKMLQGAYEFLEERIQSLADFKGSNVVTEFIPNSAINQVPATDAAYSRRDKDIFDMYLSLQYNDAKNDDVAESFAKELTAKLKAIEQSSDPEAVQQPYLNRSAVQPAPATTADEEKAADGRDPMIYKLREVRKKYDPLGMFTKFAILMEA